MNLVHWSRLEFNIIDYTRELLNLVRFMLHTASVLRSVSITLKQKVERYAEKSKCEIVIYFKGKMNVINPASQHLFHQKTCTMLILFCILNDQEILLRIYLYTSSTMWVVNIGKQLYKAYLFNNRCNFRVIWEWNKWGIKFLCTRCTINCKTYTYVAYFFFNKR